MHNCCHIKDTVPLLQCIRGCIRHQNVVWWCTATLKLLLIQYDWCLNNGISPLLWQLSNAQSSLEMLFGIVIGSFTTRKRDMSGAVDYRKGNILFGASLIKRQLICLVITYCQWKHASELFCCPPDADGVSLWYDAFSSDFHCFTWLLVKLKYQTWSSSTPLRGILKLTAYIIGCLHPILGFSLMWKKILEIIRQSKLLLSSLWPNQPDDDDVNAVKYKNL